MPTAKHYRHSPSSSNRWLVCPGSAKQYPSVTMPTSPYAESGTMAHKLVEECLTQDLPPAAFENYPEDMRRYVEKYLSDCVQRHIDKAGDKPKLLIEFLFKSKHGDGETFGGTPDLVIIDQEYVVATILDFKSGIAQQHIDDNTQLMCYAALVQEAFPEISYFNLVVYYARRDGEQCKTVTALEVLNFQQAIRKSLMFDHRVVGKHCSYCPLACECDELKQEILQLL